MEIKFNKNQYLTMLKALAIAGMQYGLLGDFVDSKYKKECKKLNELENTLCLLAKGFGCEDLVKEFEGKICLKMEESEFYDKVMADMDEYEEYSLYSLLANKLAWRDFRRDHTPEEIEKMSKEHGGYLGVPLYPYEKKYWDEFDENDYANLEIIKKPKS